MFLKSIFKKLKSSRSVNNKSIIVINNDDDYEKLTEAYEKCLNKYSSNLEDELSELFKKNIDSIHFHVGGDEYGEGGTIMLSTTYSVYGSSDAAPEKNVTLALAQYVTDLPEVALSEGVYIDADVGCMAIYEWFVECWNKVVPDKFVAFAVFGGEGHELFDETFDLNCANTKLNKFSQIEFSGKQDLLMGWFKASEATCEWIVYSSQPPVYVSDANSIEGADDLFKYVATNTTNKKLRVLVSDYVEQYEWENKFGQWTAKVMQCKSRKRNAYYSNIFCRLSS